MEDYKIVELYFVRSEEAIVQTDVKYGGLCRHIAGNILRSAQDCEECVNDTWLSAWNRIPPEKPQRLSAYVGRIARNLALKRYAYLSAEKRCEEAVCSLTELEDCISGRDSVEDELECRRIESAISDFLWRQEESARAVFIRRYWYFDSIDDICRRTGYSGSKVTSILFRMRRKLRVYLKDEGVEL